VDNNITSPNVDCENPLILPTDPTRTTCFLRRGSCDFSQRHKGPSKRVKTIDQQHWASYLFRHPEKQNYEML